MSSHDSVSNLMHSGCPRCGDVMLIEDDKNVGHAWVCPQCRGLLCTETHLNRIVGTKHIDAALLPTWRASMDGIRSPWTGEPMKSFRTKTEVSVVIDRCVDTRGVWLDEEEFNHLRNAIGDIVKAGLDLETQAKKGKREDSIPQPTDPHAMPLSWAVITDQRSMKEKRWTEKLTQTLMPTERWLKAKRTPYVTQGFMGIIAGLTVFTFTSGGNLNFEAMTTFAGLIPTDLLDPDQMWRLLTAPFISGGFLSCVIGMYLLWMLGDNVEDTLGRLFYPLFFVLTCGVGGLAVMWTDPPIGTYLAGTLISVMGLLGAYVVLFPAARIRMGFYAFTVDLPAPFFAVIWVIVLLVLNHFAVGGMSARANLAGLFFGVFFGAMYRVVVMPMRREISTSRDDANEE